MSGVSPTEHTPPAPDLTRLRRFVADEQASLLSWADKGAPAEWVGRRLDSFAGDPGDTADQPTPCLTLSRKALDHDIAAFAAWASSRGLAHAPHGKTSMAPALWLAQLEAGAWGITLANEAQVRVAHAVGVPRVLVANLVLRPKGLRWLASIADQTEVTCWVDSVDAVAQMDAALADAGRRLPVLVELGTVRTGARSVDEAVRVAEAVARAPHLELAGVGGYEGVAVKGTSAEDVTVVRRFLDDLVDLRGRVAGMVERDQAILTAGGSTWFDQVTEAFGPTTPETLCLVRAGSVVSHDDGTYLHATPSARGADGPVLTPALHLWARVLSMPEPGRAILDAGKRDFPHDSGLPVPQLGLGSSGLEPLVGHELLGSNDQHATMAVPEGSPLRVGSLVRLGISHPCTAFDKWRTIPVLDDADALEARVVDWVRTYF
ncbi:alanine racemase [Aestuariimicrobium ganziense]|uniref:alanine racemase n=1 Tax=Aestuariimicrobium ganziense TaxID=2773677 RepID=UPI0019436555|nr:alanine racemase [Aestuariimicrobium ganziense]